MEMQSEIIIVMGVSGSGKTVVGQRLAAARGSVFIDGDDLHAPDNIEKMRRGVALGDRDRAGWFDRIIGAARRLRTEARSGVIACSALKRSYRDQLRAGIDAVRFVYLKGSYEKVYQQLSGRQGHFMPIQLLASQF